MQLKIQRSQRQAGFSGKVIFCLDARVYLTAAEQANVSKYRLGGQIIYNSEASKRHLEKADQSGREGSYFKSIASVALAAMHLNISIDSLQRGQHVECKDMDELLGAEEALYSACRRLKEYLDAAATFDGREVVVDFSSEEPALVSKPVPLPAPIAPAPIVAAPATLAASVASAVAANPTASPFVDAAAVYAQTGEIDPFEQLRAWYLHLQPPMRVALIVGGLFEVYFAAFGLWVLFVLGLVAIAALFVFLRK